MPQKTNDYGSAEDNSIPVLLSVSTVNMPLLIFLKMMQEKCGRQTMLKIIIIGSPGAGKSTFARKLRDTTGIPLYYLDMLWHKPDQTTISREEFDAKLNKILKQNSWIIDGNYQRTLEARIKECDTVFLMDFPLDVCISGAESRIGKKREDLPWIESEFDKEFKQWIIDFSKKQLPQIYKTIEKYRNSKDIIIFKSRKEADNYLYQFSSGLCIYSKVCKNI